MHVTGGNMLKAVRLFTAVLLALALLGGTIFPAAAQKQPDKIRLTPQSQDGAVLIRVDTFLADSQLWLNKGGNSGFGSRVFIIDVPVGDGEAVYVARTLKPGRYRMDSVWQQKRWGIVLRGDTVEFEVKPGKIVFLGKLNNGDLLRGLQHEAVAAGKTESRGLSGFVTYKHGLKPAFSERDETGLAEAVRFTKGTMNSGADMVELAPLGESHSAD